ncbi:MAG: hydroxyisourate hydrolase [Pseudomonadota bacterium]|nr:hydroxyisourate hydrolase [Pseudomonadota bacterium]
MFTLTTHILDATNGTDAEGVPVILNAEMPDTSQKIIWSEETDIGGRVKKDFQLGEEYSDCKFILTFSIGNYFRKKPYEIRTSRISFDVNLTSPSLKYHFPVILSPYGASCWWSK